MSTKPTVDTGDKIIRFPSEDKQQSYLLEAATCPYEPKPEDHEGVVTVHYPENEPYGRDEFLVIYSDIGNKEAMEICQIGYESNIGSTVVFGDFKDRIAAVMGYGDFYSMPTEYKEGARKAFMVGHTRAELNR